MKAVFFVTGVGLGDAIRESSNIKEFLSRDKKNKVLVAGYHRSYEFFKDKYPTIRIAGYNMNGKQLRFTFWRFLVNNYLLPFVWVVLALLMKKNVKKFDPDLVVTDFEPSGIALAKVMKKKCVVVFGFDPELYLEYKKMHGVSWLMWLEAYYLEKVYMQSDAVIISTLFAGGKSYGNYYYVNPIVRATPDDLPGRSALMKELKLKKEPILVMLGGSDFGLKLASVVEEVALESDEEFMVFGGRRQLPSHKNVTFIKYTDDFLKYLKICNGLITLAGQQTLTEGVVFKKPMLIFPIQEHIEQKLNAYKLKDIAMVADTDDRKKIKEAVLNFLQNREEIRKKVETLEVKATGSEQVVDLLSLFSQQQSKR